MTLLIQVDTLTTLALPLPDGRLFLCGHCLNQASGSSGKQHLTRSPQPPAPIPISKHPEKCLVLSFPSQILNSLFPSNLMHSLYCIFAFTAGIFLSYKFLLIVACTFPLSEEPVTSFKDDLLLVKLLV